MNPTPAMNPAGGLRYHLRAWRFGRRQWQQFRWDIGEWLLGWHPKEPTLLLVGPSAGYCLQPFFFEKFDRVICLEPDPIARFLFTRKLNAAPLEKRPKLEFVSEDHLVRYPERLPKMIEGQSDVCLLFSNVIGQLRCLLNVEDDNGREFSRIRAAIGQAIAGRSWASFHDRVSGYLRPTLEHPVTSNSRLSNEEVIELLYDATQF